MYEHRDEISLRDLYLIFRRGFVFIVVAAILVAVGAFVFVGLRPHVFEAAATVQINVPAPSSASEEAAWLLAPVGIGMNTYTSLANRRDVLGAAIELRPENVDANVEQLSRLTRQLSLTAIDTAAQARGQLTVVHRATAGTAAEAAKAANLWAQASVRAATETMERAANASAESSARELAQREAELISAQEALTRFAEIDSRAALTAQVSVQQQLQRDALMRLADLDNLLVVTRARRDMLQAVMDSRTGSSNLPLELQLNALVTTGVLEAQAARDIEAALAQLPSNTSGAGQDLMVLVSRTQLESLTSDLASYAAEREFLESRLNDFGSELSSIRTQLTELSQQADQLQSAVNRAQASFDSVARLAPLVGLQQSAVSNAARVLVPAVEPLEAKPRNRLTITVAAALVAGLLATLFVFLRAAVREPDAPANAHVSGKAGAATGSAAGNS